MEMDECMVSLYEWDSECIHCTAGRIVQVHCSSFASLLERKQKEKICIHNIPEGGA